ALGFFFFQAEDGIRDFHVTGVQTCALPIFFGGQKWLSVLEGYPSGQRDQTVNLTAPPSQVRILPPPPLFCGCRIMAITSAFQADDAGSIPATRSKSKYSQF